MRRHEDPRAGDGISASVQSPEHVAASGHVALLAATALGFAYAPTADAETHAGRLATLAGPHLESLMRAQTAVLTLQVGSARARTQAAALLRRACRDVVGPCRAHLTDGAGAVAALTATTEGRP